MSVVKATQLISAPSDKVWNVISDFGGVSRFHPAVESSPLLNAKRTGLGAERQCNFYDGNSVKERIIDFDEGNGIEVEIYDGSMPLKRAIATLQVQATSISTSTVTMSIDYTMKFGPIGAAMDMLMAKRQFQKMIGQVLEGLARHIEEGVMIGRNGVATAAPLDMSAAAAGSGQRHLPGPARGMQDVLRDD